MTKIVIGGSYINNKGLSYKIIEKTRNKNKSGNLMILVKFDETGYSYEVDPSQISKGTVKDRLAKTILGIGCIGDATVGENTRAYNVWHKMLGRCYVKTHENYSLYGGSGVTVSERWKNFNNFIEDLPLISGYNQEKFDNGDLQLDKDLKQAGLNKSEMVYSLETCTFMSAYENSQLVNVDDKKGFALAISPDGEHHNVFGIKEFCRDNNLVYNSVRLVMNGSQSKYKGWQFFRLDENKNGGL